MEVVTSSNRLMHLFISELYYVPANRNRQEISAENIDALVASIKENGLINPITVYMPPGAQPPYEILAGVTRYTACRELGHTAIACRVYTEILSEYQRKTIELEENLRRTNLTDAERDVATDEIHRLLVLMAKEKGERHTQTDTAIMLGISQATVNNSISTAAKIKGLMLNNPGVDVMNLSPTKINKDFERTLAQANNKALALQAEETRAKARQKAQMVPRTLPSTPTEEPATSFDPQKMFDVIDSYIVGDFFENDCEDGQFAFIECDPPYGINLPELRDASYKGSLETEYKDVPASEYEAFVARLAEELYRLASPQSYIVWWHSIVYNHIINRELKRVGFNTRPHHLGVWVKGITSGQNRHPDINLGYSCEYFIFASKGHAKLTPEKLGRSNVFTFNKVTPSVDKHPAERPLAMMLELVDTFCSPGGMVLVPFAGSGNTLIASGLRNMPAIGYDLSDTYKGAFVKKVLETPEFKQLEMKL